MRPRAVSISIDLPIRLAPGLVVGASLLGAGKVIEVIWAGGTPPYNALAAQELPRRHGIEVFSGGNILPAMAAYKHFPGMEGATYYYFGIPKNPVNEWLVSNHYKQFKAPPDFFTAGGMTAAIAIVEALKKTGGDASPTSSSPPWKAQARGTKAARWCSKGRRRSSSWPGGPR